MSRRLLIVVMIPAALVAVARVMFLVLSVAGLHPFWLWEPLNLAEAAALRDRGEVSRLLAEGSDPNAVYLVRRGFVRNYPMKMTPVAAAMAARRDEIVQILVDGGATPLATSPDDTP